jgi:mannosyltransferase OCH1-like enzyme
MRPSIRISVILWLVFFLAIVGFIGRRAHTFAKIFFADTRAGIRLTQHQAAAAHNASTPDTRTQYIPKIIHQVFHNWKDPGNENLPEDWDKLRKTCIDANPGYEYKVSDVVLGGDVVVVGE